MLALEAQLSACCCCTASSSQDQWLNSMLQDTGFMLLPTVELFLRRTVFTVQRFPVPERHTVLGIQPSP